MRKTWKKGFTLTELIVVLVIMGIIAAIAVPFFTNYWKNAEFQKNEQNARTVYLAAESKLTYYRSSGQWESFKKQILKQAEKDKDKNDENRAAEEAVFSSDTENAAQLNGHIYTLRLDKNRSASEEKDNLLLQLIDDYIYDKDMLDASVAVEIDVDSGEVYAAFYDSRCKGLTYATEDKDGYLTMQKRSYDSRKKRLLGYYSTEDTVNVVALKPTKLRITTISLQNGEKLALNWSSNVGESLDVSYRISAYKKDGTALFSMVLSPYDVRKEGWSGKEESSAASFANVTLMNDKGENQGTWSFPLIYSDHKYSLVLDAMMSARTQALLNSRIGTEDEKTLQQTLSTSICRLAGMTKDQALASPQDMYMTVEAMSYAGTDKTLSVTREYRASDAAISNTSNTMYADKSSGNDIKIAAFRHLSNIRYFDQTKEAAFSLAEKNMDWASVGTGVYDLTNAADTGTSTIQKLSWKENRANDTVDFPTIAELGENQSFSGNGKRTLISNLKLGEDSIIDDETVQKLEQAIKHATGKTADNVHPSEYLGLFGEISGKVDDIVLQDPRISFGAGQNTGDEANAEQKTYSALKGVGILAGRSEGVLQNTSITAVKEVLSDENSEKTVNVSLVSAASFPDGRKVAAVGGVVGLMSGLDADGNLSTQNSGKLENVTMEGAIKVELPDVAAEAENSDYKEYALGAGGLVGYAQIESKNQKSVIASCENHASVSGNYMTGGIAGMIDGIATVYEASGWKDNAAIRDCYNSGLILCTSGETERLEGKYFGGIAGYANQTLIYHSTSASGRASGFTYNKNKKDLLKGQYVGGIVGYGNHSLMANCGTESNGYILGSEYVGGIAGGLGGDVNNAIQAQQESVSVTTNRSYVIGSEYVGGIVGHNASGIFLSNCINNGVVAGTQNEDGSGGRYVGGIVGYNANGATIYDCASYLSDYGNKIFDTIVNDWDAKSDYVGGIAGYNNGLIKFTDESQAIMVKSVSSIVVGNNYIGGIAGFNDVYGNLDVNYTLIGGQIYAYENCAGGAFGFNASVEAAKQNLTVRPQSVRGKYFVGGVIGANVLAVNDDTELSGLRSDNILGTITGEAFCGGVIGYQRTYYATQIDSYDNDAREYGIRAAVEAAQKKSDSAKHILPEIDAATNVPTGVMASRNEHTLTITTAGNTDTALPVSTNNIPVRAVMYSGGIVGYSENGCIYNGKVCGRIQIKNCKNTGNITFASELVSSDDEEQGAVNFGVYVSSGEIEVPDLPEDARDLGIHFIGGITGVNLQNETITHCTNTGSLSGFTGIGGVVGVNAGLVQRCELSEHFGNASLEYVGGIVGINAGTVQSCSTTAGKIITGNNHLGGIAGWNLNHGVLMYNTNYASIQASGKDAQGNAAVGGIAGQNSGVITLEQDQTSVSRFVTGAGGAGVGGVIGINEVTGEIQTGQAKGTENETVAVSDKVTVQGYEKVGGIVGINHGSCGQAETNSYLSVKVQKVQAFHGGAGGIAGITDGTVYYAVNRCETVSADAGNAGGIVAENHALIKNCNNYGNVSSSDGYAGGITAANEGTLQLCRVNSNSQTAGTVEIYSRGEEVGGAVTATNTGTVTDCYPGKNVLLRGDATSFGGIVGENTGIVTSSGAKNEAITGTAYYLTNVPQIQSQKTNLTVGGVAGINMGTISDIVAQNLSFADFSGYRYLGGIAGSNGISVNVNQQNDSDAIRVTGCMFSGTIREKVNTGEAGNCYGGIVGINYAALSQNIVSQISMDIQGVYTAASTSTATQKETMASHAGGIAGKNETNARIDHCTLTDNSKSILQAKFGMLGGVTGFNKGLIEMSGSSATAEIMTAENMKNVETLVEAAHDARKGNLSSDENPVEWYDGGADYQIENSVYENTRTKVSADRLNLKMTDYGSIGGIAAFNSTEGALDSCVSGNWFVLNRSEAIGVGTGGVIGMNESEKSLTHLINGAFVGRQVSANRYHTGKPGEEGQTNRFAGGIIGNQNTSTGNTWTIEDCINFGTVYCYRSHYSGGIIGQWTSSGGTIRDCRNYGNLQTSLQYSWSGASGGIVAQLYYAYEGNEYNIIGCENHGNLYMRKGASMASDSYGANDSAGILGNVTTYKVDTEEKGQEYTIRILDCVNGPDVEIYSSSMASGIFGFLSCDNVVNQNGSEVKISTAKVKIQVERCRNFAKVLKGRQFAGGIFGARYTNRGWSNTIVNDCYSVDLDNQYYSPVGNPIYSNGNNHDGSPADITDPDNYKNNFFINARGSKILSADYGFYYDTFMLGKSDAQGNVVSQGEGQKKVKVSRRTSGFWNQYIQNIHAVAVEKNADNTYKYAFAQIYDTCTSIGSDCLVDPDGYITDANGNRIGQILFQTEENDYKNHDVIYDQCVENPILGQAESGRSVNEIYYLTRESYRRLEGIEQDQTSGTEKLKAPVAANAEVSDGKINVSVTPDSLYPGESQKCDPFSYVIIIKGENGQTAEHTIYSEEGSFAIPENMSGTLAVSVRAKSMFEDVQDSDACEATVLQSGAILPSPDIRAELKVQQINSWKQDYRYEFSLNNLEDYDKYDGWKVTVYLNSYGKDVNVVLDADHPTAVMMDLNLGDEGKKKRNQVNNTYQIVSQATATQYQNSPVVSTSAYMPYYQAFISLNEPYKGSPDKVTNRAETSYTISGDTLDTLRVNIAIDNSASNDILEVTPVYRAELIGNWGDKKDVVFAKTDIMTVSKGVATAQFGNLPEYLKDATNLHVRLWYAQTGLGPVYLYHDVSDASDANVSELLNVDANGTEIWAYSYSWPIHNEWQDYNAYMDTSEELFTWIPAPVMDQEDGSSLKPTYDSNNRMQYTFSWDQNVAVTSTPSYEIAMTGIDETGKEVTIDTSSYHGGRTFTIDGEDWNYKQIRLKVTRIGDASEKKIGLSTTATYQVAQRLEKPGQPSVVITDNNELNYNVSWSGITDESYCAGYEIYARAYDENGTLGTAKQLGVLENIHEASSYTQRVNLEEYAGKRIIVYLVARSKQSDVFTDSAPGVTCEIQVPSRIEQPTVTWKVNWTYDTGNPMETADFLTGGLRVSLKADQSSIPPGGSAYLLRAYVYDSAKAAAEATASSPGDYVTVYPSGDIPVQMDVTDAENYYHVFDHLSIQYAGKWVVFYARISSGAGHVSSLWTRSTLAYQLPYVKLAQPDVSADTEDYQLPVSVKTTPNVPGSVQNWTAKHTVLEWNSVDCADAYEINLTGQVTDTTSVTGKRTENPQIRILETTDSSGIKHATLQQYVYRKTQETSDTHPEKWEYIWETIDENQTDDPPDTPETEKIHTWDISSYCVPISSSYTAQNGYPNYYTLTLQAQLTAQLQADGSLHYWLKLPDVEQMTAADGSTVKHSDFSVTDKADFIANVQQNLTSTQSKTYAPSDIYEIRWNN